MLNGGHERPDHRYLKSAMNEEEWFRWNENDPVGIGGWVLIYIISSIPVLLFYAAGLSGWFFDYPIPIFLLIFLLLTIPILLILVKSPKAPQWNIAMSWIASSLITLRIIYGVLFQRLQQGLPPLISEELLAVAPKLLGIVASSLGWAIVWTLYFKKSVRVISTFH